MGVGASIVVSPFYIHTYIHTLMNLSESPKLKIVVGINTLTSINAMAYRNHIGAFFRWAKQMPQLEIILNAPERTGIDRMRNLTARVALEQEADYVLFLDDDVLIDPNSLKLLIDADKDIIAGWTIIRGWPFENMFFKFNDDKNLVTYKDPIIDPVTNLIEVDAVGFSFCLIKTSLIKKVNPPYFVTGTHNTEDVYFCMKAKQQVPDVSIFIHNGCQTSHILGAEVIDVYNREHYKVFLKSAYPEVVAGNEKEHDDRGDAYLKVLNNANQ